MKNPGKTRHGKTRRSSQNQKGKDKSSTAVGSARKRTLVQLQQTITSIAEAIEDRREAFFSDPDDIETIHRFRTNTRTLRSLVAFIKPWQKSKQNAELQAILKEVVGYTSLLRELDVLEKHVRTNPDFSPKLVEFCSTEAAKERAKVLEILSSKRVTESFEGAMLMAKNIAWKKRRARHGLSADVARARFDAMIESVGKNLATLDLCDAERTHDVRKRAKRARYVAEFCGDVLGADCLDIAKDMTAHQDVLGDVCDARANIRLIDGFLRRGLSRSVVQGLNLMRTQNEDFLKATLKAAKAG